MITTIIEGLQQLIAAIQNLSVSAEAAARANASGCGCPGGEDGPSGEGIEGDPPPDGGWDDVGDPVGSAGYNTRKCAVANIVHQWVKDVVTNLNNAGVDNIANALLTGGFALAASYVVAALTGLIFGWVFVVIGAVVAIVASLVDNVVDLSTLSALLSSNDGDFVCALYDAQSSGEARTSYVAAASSLGASSGNQAFLSALFTVDDIMNTLFFAPLSSRGAELEAAISAWSGGVDCGSICSPPWWDCSYGTLVSNTDTEAVFDALPAANDYLCHIGIDVAAVIDTQQAGWTAPGDAPNFASAYDTGENRCGSGGGSPWTNVSSSFVSPGVSCHGALYRSNTPFTVTFTKS